MFKVKYQNLVSKSYANSMVHIEKLEKKKKNKDQIINHLLIFLENITRYPKRNAVINNAVTSPSLKTLPQINQRDNLLKNGKDINFDK